MGISVRPFTAVLLLLVTAFAYWLWFGLTQWSVEDAAALSVMAAQGILDHGYQLLPSGYVYHRGYLPHYALAGVLGVLGVNSFSIILLSLLMGLGSLWLVYLIAKDIIGRPWVGVVAGVLLIGLQIETFYAISPRMYMSLQFFTLLAAYGAWRGYVRGEGKYQVVAFLALIAAILSHREGVMLVIAIPASVLFVIWITRQKLPSLHWPWFLVGTLGVGLATYFIAVYSPPGNVPPISAHGGLSAGSVGPNLDPMQVMINAFQLERAFPLGLIFLPISFFLALRSVRYRDANTYYTPTYLLIIFALTTAMIITSTTRNGARFWVFLLPFYALLVSSALVVLAESFNVIKGKWVRSRLRDRVTVASLLALGIIVNIALVSLATESNVQLAREGFGFPCQNSKCNVSVGRHHLALRQWVGPDDLIISNDPSVSRYYLGRVDGYLRERRVEGGEFTTFQSESDEYLGVPLIDSDEELQKLLSEERRVWIITNHDKNWASSEATLSFLDVEYIPYYQNYFVTTFVNCVEPPCQRASRAQQ